MVVLFACFGFVVLLFFVGFLFEVPSRLFAQFSACTLFQHDKSFIDRQCLMLVRQRRQKKQTANWKERINLRGRVRQTGAASGANVDVKCACLLVILSAC